MAAASQPADREEVRRIIRLLEIDPEIREAVRHAVLTTDLVDLPQRLAETNRLLERFERATERRFEEIDRRFEHVERRLEALEAVVRDFAVAADRRFQALETDTAALRRRSDAIVGDLYERRIRDNGPAILNRLAGGLRRIAVISKTDLANDLDDAVDAGRIGDPERDEVLRADAVFRALVKASGQLVHLVIEASLSLANDDVNRAYRRAELLGKALDSRALPVAVTILSPEHVATEGVDVVVYEWEAAQIQSA